MIHFIGRKRQFGVRFRFADCREVEEVRSQRIAPGVYNLVDSFKRDVIFPSRPGSSLSPCSLPAAEEGASSPSGSQDSNWQRFKESRINSRDRIVDRMWRLLSISRTPAKEVRQRRDGKGSHFRRIYPPFPPLSSLHH
jgi:hypothetical protein